VKVAYGGKVHLAEAHAPHWALVLCSRALLPPFTWERASDDAKLTCADCRAAEGRVARDIKTQTGSRP